MKKKENIALTEEEKNRRETSRFRLLWGFIILDILLIAYIIYQIVITISH